MTIRSRSLASLVLAFLPLTLSAQITIDQPIPSAATVHVDASRDAGAKISPTIFGSFLEPIGNSTYNGLWAQILRNPSLEEGLWDAPHVREMLHEHPALARSSQLGLPLPWEPLDYAQGNRYQIDYGHAANSWRALVVLGVPGQHTGIRQEVYLPVQRELSYKGSLYARHISGPTGLTVSIREHNGAKLLASAHIVAAQTAWTKYTFTLNIPQDALHRLDPSDFIVQVEGDEQVGLDELSLMPADNLDGLDPDAVAMAKAMDTTIVRFGGNFTSTYHWRDGIGPRDKRISMMNLSWGIPEYNTFGTSEFLHFCSLIGAEPQFALNLGDGTPQEAADWVRYIDQHWHKHSGLLWELGNELWGNWNLGAPTLDQLAARTLAFSKAVHSVDPTARLIATGADPDHFTHWNSLQLGNPAGTFNYLSTHFVVTVSAIQLPHASTGFIDSAAFALPIELGRKLHDEQNQINQNPAFAHKALVAFTEWLFIGHRHGTPNFTNMGGAIDTAGLFNMLMRHTAIVPVSDMTGIMDFAGIWKDRGQVYGAPGYYAFKMYASAHPAQPVAVTTDSGAYSVQHGVTRLPDIANVPYLDIVAALNKSGSKLTLFCVNRSLNTDIPANIDVAHFATDLADIQTLRSYSISDVNDSDDPLRVIPVHTQETLHSGALHHVFPHESVTVITLHKVS
ncbi:MAG TPA: alpha-L-arabinofuranosidase C-terminal domain-containing protein [Acidobacteriaceae bacterium]|nr:alpha-L-arabinofuranosidase C-terminal domain-containing protein [Acidobacteriaceae bacterium]